MIMSLRDLLTMPRSFHVIRGMLDYGQAGCLRRVLDGIPHANVLDVGCGTGELSVMTDADYLGFDIDPGYIRYAKERFGAPNRHFMVGDVFNLPPESAGRGLATVVNVIHHFSDDEVLRILAGLKAAGIGRVLVVDVASEKMAMPLRTVLFPLDRGAYFRDSAEQRRLLGRDGWSVEMEGGYKSGICPHSVLLAVFKAN